ncbi:hypothetical protein QUB56_07935 [Microcoleus sp. AR_TQ3_B6]|uniref:hypothetical protein n=1 Tax=Microcoleus sp. AR_TQ3_B6 TaxID=3055284 RepID=UPI002FD61233
MLYVLCQIVPHVTEKGYIFGYLVLASCDRTILSLSTPIGQDLRHPSAYSVKVGANPPRIAIRDRRMSIAQNLRRFTYTGWSLKTLIE